VALFTDGRGMDIARVAKARRRFLLKHLGATGRRVLEIGALDNPTFLKSEGEVYFADYFTLKESALRHLGNASHDVNKMVEVDFVLRDTNLIHAVSIQTDITIANHVIEHLPNPIQWLRDVRTFTVPGGFIFLSVPDRRYTFDYYKSVSDAIDWIRAFDEKSVMPTYYQILRHLFLHTTLRHEQAWEGNIPDDHANRFDLAAAIEKAEGLSKVYTDVHCSVFTKDSFFRLFRDLAPMIPWQITSIEDVQPGDNEFRVLLKAQ